jgi:hypothetical protein
LKTSIFKALGLLKSCLFFDRVESRDFSKAEKERIACKSEQIQKVTTNFTQKDN